MRSVFSRFRLRSQAAMVPRRVAFSGSTLLTMKSSSRRPAMASPTISSAPPSAYISAVSISVMPRSRPSRSAAISCVRVPADLAHVPGALAERRNGLAARQADGRYRGRRHGNLSLKHHRHRAIATGHSDAKGSDDIGRKPRHWACDCA